MNSVWALVLERVKETHNVFPPWVMLVCVNDLVEELDLIDSGLCVVRC